MTGDAPLLADEAGRVWTTVDGDLRPLIVLSPFDEQVLRSVGRGADVATDPAGELRPVRLVAS